jgi:hypothetical protein
MEKIKCAVDDITKKHRSSVVWLGGDLNLPDISCWCLVFQFIFFFFAFFQIYIFLLTGLFSLAEMSVSMYTISWSPNPGSGSHLLTRDGLFVRNMSSVFSCLVGCAVDDITKKHRSSVVWLGGDLNLPDISWNSDSVTIAGHQNPVSLNNTFLELVQDNHLEQVVTFPTRHENTLDLFLTNRPSLVNICEPLPGLGISLIALSRLNFSLNCLTISDAWSSNLSLFALFQIYIFLLKRFNQLSWNILKILQESVPSKMSSFRFSQPWINRTVKQMTRRKKRSFDVVHICWQETVCSLEICLAYFHVSLGMWQPVLDDYLVQAQEIYCSMIQDFGDKQ